MLFKRSVIVAAAAAALTVPAVTLVAGPAGAETSTWHVSKVLSKSFVGPLQIEVASGRIWVADSFTSTLRRIGSKHVIANGPSPQSGGDLAGVAVDAAHDRIAYLTSNGKHTVTKFVLLRKGKVAFTRDLAKFEATYNPDGRNHYGVDHPSSCVRKALNDAHIPVKYTGEKDSHPYAVAFLGGTRWAVADAGGNDVLIVNAATGKVATAAVLPRQGFTVSRAFAQANHLSSCTVGVKYYTEPVPTDVEVGPHGQLYVSVLPGGPEGPGVPPRGKVYTISKTGKVHQIGRGFAEATNLAVTPTGVVYVAELGSGKVAVLHNGTPSTIVRLPGVASLEYKYGALWAGTAPAATGSQAPGEVVKISK